MDPRRLAVALLILAGSSLSADEAPPRSLDPRIRIDLFAENPQIVTPTGIDVDHRGRVWALESNTHFPPEGYQGHPTDRLLVMSDEDGNGRADRIVVFTDELRQAMSVALRPVWFAAEKSATRNRQSANPTSAYVATRREIRLFHDDDGDDRADRSERIVHLETTGNYPHNGLAGFAFDALGWMHFGFGENEGVAYKIIGADGTTLTGGGEGGSLYRCRLDGSKLERWATGFWNPHASCFDAFGRLFTVDNDADSRPPCRLLHIIPGGDYGYRYRNGRKGLHPFTSWNGEIPGTLPMVAGTGEAPSGILAYESDGLPEEYLGNLICTSWGDHRIDRFRLKPRGASFESLAEPLIVGGENFRPVGIACAPDGSLYLTDWVLRDYNLHGRGRVWRIAATAPPTLEANAGTRGTHDAFDRRVSSARIDLRRQAAQSLNSSPQGRKHLVRILVDEGHSGRSRIEALWAVANVPTVEQNLLDDFPELWRRLLQYDEVSQAAYRLIGTPQFPVEGYTDWVHSENRRGSHPQELQATAAERSATVLELLPHSKHFKLGGLTIFHALQQHDAFLFAAVVNRLHDVPGDAEVNLSAEDASESLLEGLAPQLRLAALLAVRRLWGRETPTPQLERILRSTIEDGDESIRRAAIQWVAEARFQQFRPLVEAILRDPVITADLFLATLAALEMLDGVPPAQFDQTPPGKYVLPLVKDEARPAAVRALALRMVDPHDPALDDALLGRLVASDDAPLRLEAVRTLQQSSIERALSPLTTIAADESLDVGLRAEAVVGLARPGEDGRLSPEARNVLLKLLAGDNAILRREALRGLRAFVSIDVAVKDAVRKLSKTEAAASDPLKGEIALALNDAAGASPLPAGEALRAALLEATREADDAGAGRRTFYHAGGAGCVKCHTVNGRGGNVGPDLSTIGRSLSREKLIDSILDPGKEIAPQFVAWTFETAAGGVFTGMLVHENEGRTILGDAEGKTVELKTIDIVSRVPQKVSIMPEKLAERMSLAELRDLLAYLESLK